MLIIYPIIHDSNKLERLFFSEKKSEFKSFFFYNISKLPANNFLRNMRYKKIVPGDDFSNFTKMLTRRGLLAKFRNLVILTLKTLFFDNVLINQILILTKNYYLTSLFLYTFQDLWKINFLFKLTFHRLDKNVRKYNRKRKIKITFKYNYVPPFKRSQLTMKLIGKFAKFGNETKYFKNFISLVTNITKGDADSILYKLNIFTFKKIKNFSFQKTLLSSI